MIKSKESISSPGKNVEDRNNLVRLVEFLLHEQQISEDDSRTLKRDYKKEDWIVLTSLGDKVKL